MKKLIGLLILIVLISGCTGSIPNPLGNTEDIILNPEKYYEQEVTIKASPFVNWDAIYLADLDVDYSINTDDREGKPIYLALKYEQFYCHNCKITGIIKRVEVCDCQEHTCIGCAVDSKNCHENMKWKSYGLFAGGKVTVERCNAEDEKIRESSTCPDWEIACGSGTIEYYYYLDVIDVEALD